MTRWGPWATITWSLGALVAFYAAQTSFVLAYVAALLTHPSADQVNAALARLQADGDVFAVSTLIAAPFALLVTFAAVKLKGGATFADTLALRQPAPRALARWLGAGLLFYVASDLLTWILGLPLVPEFSHAVYRSASGKGVFIFAVILVSPAWEEVVFRGLLISGLRPSRLGASGAILASAAVWAAIHIQYDLYEGMTIFAYGLLLGAARCRTGSIAVPIAMHVMQNALAMIETAILASP